MFLTLSKFGARLPDTIYFCNAVRFISASNSKQMLPMGEQDRYRLF
jgi:hypothetical protein